MTTTTPTSLNGLPAPRLRTLGWVLRRAAIGIVVLVSFVAGGAWLLHAGIDAGAESAAQTQSE